MLFNLRHMGYNDKRFFSHRKAHYGSVSQCKLGSEQPIFKKIDRMSIIEDLSRFYKNGKLS